MRLLLIRRAETESNAALRYGGQAAVPLNQRGRQQASAVAKRLVNESATVLYASDLTRAAETAALIGAALGLVVQPLHELCEIDLGQSEMLTPEDLYRRFPDQIREFARDPARPVRSGGESYAQLGQRAGQLLGRFASEKHTTVLAVTHGGLIRATLHEVIGLELAAFPRLVLDTCGLTELRHGPSGWRLHCLNDTAHLAGGAP